MKLKGELHTFVKYDWNSVEEEVYDYYYVSNSLIIRSAFFTTEFSFNDRDFE